MKSRLALTFVALAIGCRGAGKDKAPDPLADVKQAYGLLMRCVLGPPLGADEKAVDRIQRINLGWAVEPRGLTANEWTRACEPKVEQLVEVLDKLATKSDELQRLRMRLDLVRTGKSPGMWVAGKPRAVIDDILDDAKSAGLEHPAAPAAIEAPKPVAPTFGIANLHRLGDPLGHWLRVESYPTRELRALMVDDNGGYGCVFALAGAARCAPNEIKIGSLAVPQSGGGDEWVVLDFVEKKTRVIFGGKAFPVSVEHDGYVLPDGSFVGWDPDARAVVHVARDGKVTRTPLPTSPKLRVLDSTGGYLFLLDEAGTGAATLSLQALTAGPLEKPVEVGKVPRGLKRVSVCREGGDLAAILGFDGASASDAFALALFRKGGVHTLTAPMNFAMARQSELEIDRSVRRDCAPGSISLTWSAPNNAIARLVCTKDKCTAATSKPLPGPHAPHTRMKVASLGDGVLVARTLGAPSPLRGSAFSLQVRFASLGKLHEGPWRIVLGSEEVGGPKGVYLGLDLVTLGQQAILFSYNDDGLYGIRVDEKGAMTPLQ